MISLQGVPGVEPAHEAQQSKHSKWLEGWPHARSRSSEGFHGQDVVERIRVGAIRAAATADSVFHAVVAQQHVIADKGEELVGPWPTVEQVVAGTGFEVVASSPPSSLVWKRIR